MDTNDPSLFTVVAHMLPSLELDVTEQGNRVPPKRVTLGSGGSHERMKF